MGRLGILLRRFGGIVGRPGILLKRFGSVLARYSLKTVKNHVHGRQNKDPEGSEGDVERLGGIGGRPGILWRRFGSVLARYLNQDGHNDSIQASLRRAKPDATVPEQPCLSWCRHLQPSQSCCWHLYSTRIIISAREHC